MVGKISIEELLPLVRKQWKLYNLEATHSCLFFIYKGKHSVIPSQLIISSEKLANIHENGFIDRTADKFIKKNLVPDWIVFIDSENNRLSAVDIGESKLINEALSSNVVTDSRFSQNVVEKFGILLKEHVKNG